MAEVSKDSDSLEQRLAKLAETAKELESMLPSRSGVSPPWICPYNYPPGRTDCIIFWKRSDIDALVTPCANKVLDAFNSENSTDYELTDCLDVCASTDYPPFAHCNFTAKPKTRPYVAGDYSPKFFFAEIRVQANREKYPASYSILQGVNTKLGCKMCPDVIAHPTSGPHEELYFRRLLSPHFFRGKGC